MKRYLALLLFTTLGLRAEIEFSGFFLTSQESKFSLTDTATHTSSGWLTTQQTFQGYTIAAFDPKREILTLKRGRLSMELPLREAKTKTARTTIHGVISIGAGEKIEGIRASLFADEDTAFPLKNGLTFYLRAKQLPDGNLEFRARFVKLKADGTEETLAEPALTALAGQPFAMQVGDYGFSFAP